MKFKYAKGSAVIHNRTGEKGIVCRVLGLKNEVVEVNTLKGNIIKQWLVSGVQVHTVKFCDEPDNFQIATKVLKKGIRVTNIKTGDNGIVVKILPDAAMVHVEIVGRNVIKRWPLRFITLSEITFEENDIVRNLISGTIAIITSSQLFGRLSTHRVVNSTGVKFWRLSSIEHLDYTEKVFNPNKIDEIDWCKKLIANEQVTFKEGDETEQVTFKEGDVVKRKGTDLVGIVTNQDCMTDSRIIRVTDVDNSNNISLWSKEDVEHFSKAAQCGHTSSLEYKVGDLVLHAPTETCGIVSGFLLPSSEKISVRVPHLNNLIVTWRLEHMEKIQMIGSK